MKTRSAALVSMLCVWHTNAAAQAWILASTTGPSVRIHHAMAYDSRRGQTVLFGGVGSGGPLADTWEWNGAGWALVASTGPARRQEFAMVYDEQRAVTVLHGGNYAANYHDTWEWDGTVWRQTSDSGPTRFAHAMT